MDYQTKKVSFKNALGNVIDARLEQPNVETKTFAIFAHCFTCSKDVHVASRISRSLTKVGIAVLRFDFTGLGNSDGDFANTNFSTNVSDLVSAYHFLQDNYGRPEILIGHSLGGAAVLAGVDSMPSIKLISTIGAPSDVVHLEHILANNIKTIESEGEADVQLAGRTFKFKKQFLEDIRSIDLDEKIQKITASLLIFHSPEDRVVSIDHAEKIYNAAHHPKSIICIDEASHMLDRVEDSEFVAKVMSAWCLRNITNQKFKSHVMTEDEKIDQAIMESFPASDPPGYMSKSAVDQQMHQQDY